jgi:hypothetical protein
MDSAGQSSLNAALIRAIFAAHASCAPVRAELQKRKHVSRRMLAEMFQIGQRRGEIRSDIPASALASMTQTIFMGLTMSWALNPESTLRKASNDVWQLICPTLKPVARASLNTTGGPNNVTRRKHSRRTKPKLS